MKPTQCWKYYSSHLEFCKTMQVCLFWTFIYIIERLLDSEVISHHLSVWFWENSDYYNVSCRCHDTRLICWIPGCVFLSLSDSENAPEDEDDLYAVVCGLEDNCTGGKIYEDLMRAEQPPPLVLVWVTHRNTHTHTSWDVSGDEHEGNWSRFFWNWSWRFLFCSPRDRTGQHSAVKPWTRFSSQRRLCFQTQAEVDVRSCCLSEIKQTEEKYTETLESIEKVFFNMDHSPISDVSLNQRNIVILKTMQDSFFLTRWPSRYVLISSGSGVCRFQSEHNIAFHPWRFSLLFSISWILWRNSSLLLKSIESSSTFR